jgi:putative peptidoglycan lipid II flippase
MSRTLTRSSLRKQTIYLSIATIASRVLGLVREILMARYLGVSQAGEAFVVAFKIPNSLRKIFGEGALSAALIPTLADAYKNDGKDNVSRTITLVLVTFLTFIALVCALISFAAPTVVYFSVPGWFSRENSSELIPQTITLVRIMSWFIISISGISIFACSLQIKNKFLLPALLPFLLNVGYIVSLIWCYYYQFPPEYLAYSYLFFSVITLIIHYVAYRIEGFTFKMPNAESIRYTYDVLIKFLPCIITLGAVEINLYIDQMISSYLPEGSVNLIYYSSAFVRFPLAMFAQGFSIIFLTHVARIASYAPNRLSFVLYEALKLTWWVTLPCTIVMIAFSHDGLNTLLLSKQFPSDKIAIAATLLSIHVSALFFYSINKLLVSFFYSVHDTVLPTYCTVATTALNTILNLVLINFYGIYGILLATVIAEGVKTFMFLWFLVRRHNFTLYGKRLLKDLSLITLHASIILVGFFVSYRLILYAISLNTTVSILFNAHSWLLWIWLLPLVCLWGILYWYTYTKAPYKLFFLN